MTEASALRERIEASWKELSERVTKLGPGGLMLAAPDGWAVKDHLANVAAWEHSLLETPEQVLDYFRESHAALMVALGKLSDADLQKPYSHFQPTDSKQKRPVIGWVAGNTYEHYAEHIGWIDHLVKESSAAR